VDTEGTATQVADIYPGPNSSAPSPFKEFPAVDIDPNQETTDILPVPEGFDLM